MRNRLVAPILLITFNRLDETKKVFESIRKVQPSRLYISSDGPRENVDGEVESITRIRKWLLDNVDWKCEVQTIFRDSNHGCKYAVSKAISWFFEFEESGIILEDDSVPTEDFYFYAQNGLIKYKNDSKVMMITGTNFLDGDNADLPPIFLSRVFSVWGWATWKRAWELYDVDLRQFEQHELLRFLRRSNAKPFVMRYYLETFRMAKLTTQTWDYQWGFTCLLNQGTCLTPQVNLVENIGVVGAHYSEQTNDHFRATYPFPSHNYVDYEPDPEVLRFYDDKLHSKRHYKYKLRWIVIISVINKLHLYKFFSKLKRKLNF